MDGIFSVSTFGKEVVALDYPASRIELSPADELVGESVPVWFFSNGVLISLGVNGKHQGLFLLDTGAVTSVLSHSMAAALGIELAGVVGYDLLKD